jgi:hypothetical protein
MIDIIDAIISVLQATASAAWTSMPAGALPYGASIVRVNYSDTRTRVLTTIKLDLPLPELMTHSDILVLDDDQPLQV